MVIWLRLLLLALGLFASSAHALVPFVTGYYIEQSSLVSSTREGACSNYVAWTQAQPNWPANNYATGVIEGTGCRYKIFRRSDDALQSSTLKVITTATGTACPAHSSPATGGCQCSTGYNESGGQCVNADAACAPGFGAAKVVNWTYGWTRTPNDGDNQFIGPPNALPSAGEICQDSCRVAMNSTPKNVWRSQQPTAQGLYRTSIDFEGIGLGKACTPGTAAPNNPSSPDQTCPGYVGEVNGVKGCYGTADKPVAPVGGNPGATPLAGNPAAGPKPASGEGAGADGAGRTPAAGTGGNSGGPAAAAVGGRGGNAGGSASGSGTTTAPTPGEEQAACGAPGQPQCKIDETGTPTGADVAGKFTEAEAALTAENGKMTTHRGTVSGSSDKGFFSGFSNLWAAPPIAACEPIPLPESVGKSLDPCQVVDGVRTMVGYAWAIGGLVLCFGMIKRVI